MTQKLYETTNVPDNWVPPGFLTRLQKNVNLKIIDLGTVIVYSGLVFQHLCGISLFVTYYVFLLWKWVTPYHLTLAIVFLTIFGSTLWFFFALSIEQRNLANVFNSVRVGMVILVFSSALAPALHSLLDTVSTDTINAMTFVFLLLNFLTLPYANGMRAARADGTVDSNVVSVATGYLASLCMASQLPGPKETLLLIISATLVFATWPSISHRIQVSNGKAVRLTITFLMGLTASVSLVPFFFTEAVELKYKRLLAFASVFSTFIANFGAPFLFCKMQMIKANINGPWDEAIIEY